MREFKPCQGKTACRDDGITCLTCGRSLAEIARLRQLLSELTGMVIEYDYQNVDQFSDYVAKKIRKSVEFQKEKEDD